MTVITTQNAGILDSQPPKALENVVIKSIGPHSASIDTVRHFLFDTYCQVDGWYPPEGDPTGYRADNQTGRIFDDWDEVSTYFIAVIANHDTRPDIFEDGIDEMVGSLRLSPRRDGKFQVELYDTIVNSQNDYSAFEVEMDRFSVLPPPLRETPSRLLLREPLKTFKTVGVQTLKTELGLLLQNAAIAWAAGHGMRVFGTATDERSIERLSSLGIPQIDTFKPFRFLGDEPGIEAKIVGCVTLEQQRRALEKIKQEINELRMAKMDDE